ncbi:MAG: tetratricopeptide repeat protein [Muribaculaceae bacterium]|nr:tetratricopeptide repeat protein [Muribaculaceae bacterium]
MKQIVLLALLIWTCSSAAASRLQQANDAYNRELYNQALQIYLSQEKTGEVSADLYYNIGNTYYRLKDNGHAVLYYERALLLDPSNKDARFNLEYVRERAGLQIDEGNSFFSLWTEEKVSHLSSNNWATIALVSFLLVLAALALYIFSDSTLFRKIGFFGGLLVALVCALSLVCSWHMCDKVQNRTDAIVMAEDATFSTAPRAPKDQSEVAFKLKQGIKISVVDSVKVADKKWCQVKLTDGRVAWILAGDIEII